MRTVYIKAGKQLTLLDGKRAIVKGWPNRPSTVEQLKNHTGNVGWILGETDLVIDIDFRNGGKEGFKSLNAAIIEKVKPHVNTPGGQHCYLTIPKGLKLKKKMAAFPGVDFLTKGSYCLIVGSSFNNKNYVWAGTAHFKQDSAPDELLRLLQDVDLQSLKKKKKRPEK